MQHLAGGVEIAAVVDGIAEAVILDHIGLNHLTWERAAYVDGVDRLPSLLDEHLETVADGLRLPTEVVMALRAVPSYYLRYFYCHDEVVPGLTELRGIARIVGGTAPAIAHELSGELVVLRFSDQSVRRATDVAGVLPTGKRRLGCCCCTRATANCTTRKRSSSAPKRRARSSGKPR